MDSGPLSGAQVVAGMTASVVMGSAAPAVVAERAPESIRAAADCSRRTSADVRGAVLNALAGAGQPMLSAMLETGEWQVEGNELVIKVAQSATVIEMSLGADAKRLIIATASGALGRPVKLRVVSGGVAQAAGRGRYREMAEAGAAPSRIPWSGA